MLKRTWKWKARRRRIVTLRKGIAETYEEVLRNAKSAQERGEAYQLASSMVQQEQNELEYLLQERLQQKLEVPDEHWNDKDAWEKPTLTHKGEAWARRELRKIWMSDVEFWAKLVLPLIAIIISVIALVRSR